VKDVSDERFKNLFDAACKARQSAYAPYSNFKVGAALLTAGGRIFTGCNVENLSFGLAICAERAAVTAAIGANEREFRALVVVADSREPVTPCGACRQVLAEFAPSLPVRSANLNGHVFEASLAELLPRPAAGILDRPCST
jgi:cytidine deaminase